MCGDNDHSENQIPDWAYRVVNSKYTMPTFGIISFVESFALPVIPDTISMLISALRPRAWIRVTIIGTIASTLGGIVGYLFGYTIFQHLVEIGIINNQTEIYYVAQKYISVAPFLTIFIAAFTPIPYKVFTILAGLFQVNIISFTLASILGRGLRYGIEDYLSAKYGRKIINKILIFTNKTGIRLLVLLILFIILCYYLFS